MDADNLALAERWAELFNNDVDALIDELYDPECTVLGARLGHDRLRAFEQRVLAAAPRRAARFTRCTPPAMWWWSRASWSIRIRAPIGSCRSAPS